MVEESIFNEYRRANDTKVDQLTTTLVIHTTKEEARDADIMKKIEILTTNVEALLQMWEQAKGIVNFVKILSGIAAGAAAAFIFLSKYITWK